MSLLGYLFSVASSLVVGKEDNSFCFFPEVETAYIDGESNTTTLRTVLPSVATRVLQLLLDPSDPLTLQITCVLQPSCYSYTRLRDTSAHRNGWLRRFVQEIEQIKEHLQVFVIYSPSKYTTFVPYKRLEGDLNGVPTIVFTHHLLSMLQSATSIDEENAILAFMVISFLRELNHLLLYRRVRLLSSVTSLT
jgi:hypothetical protein